MDNSILAWQRQIFHSFNPALLSDGQPTQDWWLRGGWLVHQCAVKQPPNSFQTDLRETYVFLRTASKLQLDLLPGQPSAGLGTGYKTIRPEVSS